MDSGVPRPHPPHEQSAGAYVTVSFGRVSCFWVVLRCTPLTQEVVLAYQRLQVQLSAEEYASLVAAKERSGVSMRVFLLGLLARFEGQSARVEVEAYAEREREAAKVPPVIKTPVEAAQAAAEVASRASRPFTPYSKEAQARGKR